MNNPHITLGPTDLQNALYGAEARWKDSVARGLRNRYTGSLEAQKRINLEGCYYEVALAVWLGIEGFVPSYGTGHDPDVVGYQVRGASEHYKGLLIRPRDVLGYVYVLITGISPKFWIRGWSYGYEVVAHGMQYLADQTHKDDCFILPNRKLHSLETLPKVNLDGSVPE